MSWTVVIIVMLACGAISSSITREKGRGSSEGWLLGIFLGLIGLIIAACLSDQSSAAKEEDVSFDHYEKESGWWPRLRNFLSR